MYVCMYVCMYVYVCMQIAKNVSVTRRFRQELFGTLELDIEEAIRTIIIQPNHDYHAYGRCGP